MTMFDTGKLTELISNNGHLIDLFKNDKYVSMEDLMTGRKTVLFSIKNWDLFSYTIVEYLKSSLGVLDNYTYTYNNIKDELLINMGELCVMAIRADESYIVEC